MSPHAARILADPAAITPAFRWAVGGWTFFVAENVVLSENRELLIRRCGEDGYRAAYGTCSTVAVASIAYGYLRKVREAGPFRWAATAAAPPGWRAVGVALGCFGAVTASQTLPRFQIPFASTASDEDTPSAAAAVSSSSSGRWRVRCPFDFSDEPSSSRSSSDVAYAPRGVERVTRHPGLWSFAAIGAGVAATSRSLPRAACLCGPVLVAAVGGAHQDSRHRRGIGGTLDPARDAVTSHAPFAAMLTRRSNDDVDWAREFKELNAAVALLVVAAATRGRGLATRSAFKL